MASDIEPTTVHTYVKQWRKHRDLTQEQLAERVGMSPPAISQLENNKQGFTGESLARLAQALGCSPAALLGADPLRKDSFWLLFEDAEHLQGPNRETLRVILKAALDRFRQE